LSVRSSVALPIRDSCRIRLVVWPRIARCRLKHRWASGILSMNNIPPRIALHYYSAITHILLSFIRSGMEFHVLIGWAEELLTPGVHALGGRWLRQLWRGFVDGARARRNMLCLADEDMNNACCAASCAKRISGNCGLGGCQTIRVELCRSCQIAALNTGFYQPKASLPWRPLLGWLPAQRNERRFRLVVAAKANSEDSRKAIKIEQNQKINQPSIPAGVFYSLYQDVPSIQWTNTSFSSDIEPAKTIEAQVRENSSGLSIKGLKSLRGT